MQLAYVVLGLIASTQARMLLDGTQCTDPLGDCTTGLDCCTGLCNLDGTCVDDSCADEIGDMCKLDKDLSWLCCEGLKCVDDGKDGRVCVQCVAPEECAPGFTCVEGACQEILPCGDKNFGPCDSIVCPDGVTILEPACIEYKKDKYKCDDETLSCPAVVVPPPTVPAPAPPTEGCADLGEGCWKNSDCCFYEGVFCDENEKCTAPEVIVTEESNGNGETLSLGGETIADSDVKTGGFSNPFGFFSDARTKTGGLSFGGGQTTSGRANARGGFSLGLFGRKPEIIGATEGKARSNGAAIGDLTSTNTVTKSEALGFTGLDGELPAVGQRSVAKGETLAAGYEIGGSSESNTDGTSALVTPESASLAGSNSRNSAGFEGTGVGFANTRGTSTTKTDPYSSYSKSTGRSSSGVSFLG